MWGDCLAILREFRAGVIHDPWTALPILCDRLEDNGNAFCLEASNAIRYWYQVRRGMQPNDQQYDEWLSRINQKYGSPQTQECDRYGDPVSRMYDRLLTFYTTAWFSNEINTEFVENQPILALHVERVSWNCIGRLPWKGFKNVERAVLDFRGSRDIIDIGVLHAIERMKMQCLKYLKIHSEQPRRANLLKGQVSVCVMEAVEEGRLPRGLRVQWNEEWL